MVEKRVRRFDVWLVSLDPTQGSEIQKTRPCVIVSPDEMAALKTAIVAPMTSRGFDYPTRIRCTFQGKAGLILLDQIRAVDKSRLVRKVGAISPSARIKTMACLQELFAY